MFIFNSYHKFKIVSFKERIYPSRYSDTCVIKEPSRRVDSILESIFNYGVIPRVFPEELQIDLTRSCGYKYTVNRYFNGIRTKRKPPKDCLNCSFPHKDLTPEIPLSIFNIIIDIFSSFGGRQVFFTGGGEPGNYLDFIRALEIVSEKGLEFGFNTNGTALLLLNREPDEKLLQLYQKTSRIRPQYISLSVHDLDDLSIFEQMKYLSDRLKRLGLNVHLRTSFLIYSDTTEEEARYFLVKSKLYGANIASFKPAYSFDPKQECRLFGRNQEIFDTISKLIEIYNCSSFTVNGPRINRLRSDFKPSNSPICFAPLEKVYVNVFGQLAMCCDRKDHSQGNIPPAVISETFLATPEEYYRKSLKWILLYRDWQNCVLGCNQQEFNSMSYEYLKSFPFFKKYLRLLDLSETYIDPEISRIFNT